MKDEGDPKVHSLEEMRQKRSVGGSRASADDQDAICLHPFDLDEDTVSVDENGISVLLSEELGGVYMDQETAISLGVVLIQAALEKAMLDRGQLTKPEGPEAG